MYKPNFKKGKGLVPAIIQDYKTGKILMLGFVNEVAWEKTLQTNLVHFYSRTRDTLWLKGETSGNYLVVKEIYIDCDEDTILLKVESKGPVCHEGYKTCFYRKLENNELKIIEKRVCDPGEAYGKA